MKIRKSQKSRIHGFTDSRIHGFTDSQIHGFTDSRIHGSTDPRIHGFTDSRIHGFTDSRIHGFTDSRIHGFTESRIHGFTDLRVPAFMLSCYGFNRKTSFSKSLHHSVPFSIFLNIQYTINYDKLVKCCRKIRKQQNSGNDTRRMV